MRLWKWIGVAGIAGVAATGVILAREERARRAYTPDDVRARLHERAARLPPEPELPAPHPGPLSALREKFRGIWAGLGNMSPSPRVRSGPDDAD